MANRCVKKSISEETQIKKLCFRSSRMLTYHISFRFQSGKIALASMQMEIETNLLKTNLVIFFRRQKTIIPFVLIAHFLRTISKGMIRSCQRCFLTLI